MGLSGNKAKQRIQDDPRNLRWATDTSAPGYRLLASMGWDPDKKASLGITAPTFTKKIAAVPTAKDGMLGLGARKGGAALAGPRSMMSSSSSSRPTAKMGFVTAGAASTDSEGKKTGTGGEFGSLLARLNSSTPVSSAPVSDAENELPPAPRSVTVNPRIASRAKHLKSKRMAASDALAMSEILGIAPGTLPPTLSASASPATSTPTTSTPETPVVEEPAPALTTSTTKFPMFSAGKTIESTFEEPVPSTSATTLDAAPEAEDKVQSKEEKKAEERKRKEEKRAKKEAKKLAAATAAVESGDVPVVAVADAEPETVKKDKKRKKKRKLEEVEAEGDAEPPAEPEKSKKRKHADDEDAKESKAERKARKAAAKKAKSSSDDS